MECFIKKEGDIYLHKKFDQRKRSRDSCEDSVSGYSTCSTEEQHSDFNSSSPKRRRITMQEYNHKSSDSYDTDVSINPSKEQKMCTTKPATSAALTNSSANTGKIGDEILRTVCKYYGNMARKFPQKQRTQKDQERRNKNTIACRVSRRVKKLEHIAFEEKCEEQWQQHLLNMEDTSCLSVYLKELRKLSDKE